jgi:ATP-dependent RNA helicase RhlE
LKTFEELDLIAPVQRALADEKYETPTPIQAQTIPAALVGRDVLGCAQTGTGKTAAFALPILNRLGQRNRKATPNRPFVLVLAPTRELAIQIGGSFATYGRHLRLRHALVYGGVSQGNQVRALNRGAHILVATPGRLLDLMNQEYIKLDQLETFVLDEADRMLDMGFLPDLKRIISKLPEQRQSLFFSATLPSKIIQLSHRLLRNPVSVNVTPKSTTLEKIEQRVLFVERSGKQALLRDILRADGVERALVFTKTKRTANVLSERLVRSGIAATAIHGNKSQSARQRALEAFRRKQVQVLVATDVAARGIDIDGITHVVNFDLPLEPEGYIHRIGRTGRAGAKGVALSFCCASERRELRAIERLIGQKVPVATEQSQSELREHKTSPQSRSRRDAALQRPASKNSRPQQPAACGSANASGAEDKPKQGRRRRKRPHLRQRVQQTS